MPPTAVGICLSLDDFLLGKQALVLRDLCEPAGCGFFTIMPSRVSVSNTESEPYFIGFDSTCGGGIHGGSFGRAQITVIIR